MNTRKTLIEHHRGNIPTTLFELVLQVGKLYGERTAFSFFEKGVMSSFSYADFAQECTSTKQRLVGIIGKGDRVALSTFTPYRWVVCFFAIVGCGGVAVLLPPEGVRDPRELAKKTNCTLFIGEGHQSASEGIKTLTFDEITDLPRQDTDITVRPSDPAAILFTSGTSGEAKAAVLTHENLLISGYHPSTRITFEEGGIYLAVLPLYHIFGLTCGLFSFLLGGAPIHINENRMDFFKEIERLNPTCLVLVPALAAAIAQYIIIKGKDNFCPALKTIVLGGAATDDKVLNLLLNNGIEIFQGYGMTECGVVCSSDGSARSAHTIGKPFEHSRIMLKDGEILVGGATVFKGYLNSNEDCFTEDGLFKTGDLGRYNSDGNLMIVGRKNFLIITDEGENVSPEELEGEILLIPNVKECLVYGEGGVICCDIYCDKVDFEQCREGVRQQNRNLPPYKQIKNIRYRSCEFSKNSVGKIVRGGDNVQ